jgi:hypothetical protein
VVIHANKEVALATSTNADVYVVISNVRIRIMRLSLLDIRTYIMHLLSTSVRLLFTIRI